MAAIILGEENFTYQGRRFPYEWDCCWLGWSLGQLNPTLLEGKGVLQRAVDNVMSFVFDGCTSRTKRRLPVNVPEVHQPPPSWLPGLVNDKIQKNNLFQLQKEAEAEYTRRVTGTNDPKIMKEASRAAVQFYALCVHGKLAPSCMLENINLIEEPQGNTLTYVNILSDPHLDTFYPQRTRVNCFVGDVNENIISIQLEGMGFGEGFDTNNIDDPSLRSRIESRRAMLKHYCEHDIGLIERPGEVLPSLAELVIRCGLNIEDYEARWKDFKLRMNGLRFKIVCSLL